MMARANTPALMKTHPRSTFPPLPPSPRHRTGRRTQRRPLDDDSVRTAPQGFPICSAIAETPGARPPPPQTFQAPSGARCFLAGRQYRPPDAGMGRNAPSGARCFLARHQPGRARRPRRVVMHLLALGAFWWHRAHRHGHRRRVVMHLLARGTFWSSGRTTCGAFTPCRNAPSGAKCFLARHFLIKHGPTILS